MLATVHVDDTAIVVDCPPRLKDLVKEIPGSRFQGRSGTIWYLPRTLNAAVQLVGQLGFAHLDLNATFLEFVSQEKDTESTLAHIRATALDPDCWPSGERGYQAPAIEFIREAGSAVLGDDPGTGKTFMAAQWITNGPTLLVCPKTVQVQWRRELERFRPDLAPTVLSGTATQRRKQLAAFEASPGAVLIATYDQLPLHSRLAPYGAIKLTADQKTPKELNAIRWCSVVADEAHRAFNPKTRWTRALWWLADHAERRLALTGTPQESNPLEFWALLRLVAADEWPTRSKAQSYYMMSSPGFFGGIEVTGLRWDRREEWDRLVARRFLRRPKSLVLPFLPKKVYERRDVALPKALRQQYTELRTEMMAEVPAPGAPDADTAILMVDKSGALYTRLVQAASAALEIVGYEEVEVRNADGSTELRTKPLVRLSEPSPKLDAAMEVLGDLGDQPVLITARSRQLLDLLVARFEKAGTPHAAILGGMRADEIDYAKQQFNSGEVNLLLLSVSSAAEGLSLTRGSTIIRLDRSPKRRDNVQAEDRMHGTGRGDQAAEHLLIIDLVAEDTVEAEQLESLAIKDDKFADTFGEEA